MLGRGKERVFNIKSIVILFICFTITYMLEAGFAFITGKSSKKAMLIIFLANIITNPAANLVYWIAGRHFNKITVIFVIETFVVLAEWRCYSGFKHEFTNPARFSFIANVISYVAGSIILLFIRGFYNGI